ncbi:MAG: cupin domain-containing protein [Nitrosopumilaceae archaeon]|jgi:mannose-6-phosphate isomerase-like protein (cupin superfamily)
MSIQKNSEIPLIPGIEGTTVKQHFHPHNTLNGIRFSLAEFTLKVGKKSRPHKLKSSEVYFFLEGKGGLHVNEEFFEVAEGDSAYVPPMSVQFLENSGEVDLKFLCIVDPAWKADDEIILE